MKNKYYNDFILKFGIDIWNYDERLWLNRGYKIDKNTGYLVTNY